MATLESDVGFRRAWGAVLVTVAIAIIAASLLRLSAARIVALVVFALGVGLGLASLLVPRTPAARLPPSSVLRNAGVYTSIAGAAAVVWQFDVVGALVAVATGVLLVGALILIRGRK